MKKLTFKQKKLAKEYIKTNGNGTQAVLRSYNTTDPRTASVIATRELGKDNVQAELKRLLTQSDLELPKIASKLANILASEPAKGYSGADIMDAVKTSLKLHGVLTDKKQVTSYNLNATLNNLSEHELRQLRESKKKETDTILADE